MVIVDNDEGDEYGQAHCFIFPLAHYAASDIGTKGRNKHSHPKHHERHIYLSADTNTALPSRPKELQSYLLSLQNCLLSLN